ncbi:MAG TPA: DUF222 domain-containing protein [Actinomycetota bacterium]|nr:DUF222 domain-containing protein [Actinomycetota bacterium]
MQAALAIKTKTASSAQPDGLPALRARLKDIVRELEPERLTGKSAARLVEEFAAIENLAVAGKTLCAGRVAESGAWQASGEKTAAHWMAKTTGTSVGSAVASIETAARLAELPITNAAVRAGKLSDAQAKEIASAAAAAPTAESRLLQVAKSDSLHGLKETCAKVKAAALPDENERYRRIHERRRFRHRTDGDGAFRIDALLTPDKGATVLAALEPIKERVFADARKQGRREPFEAYAADALVEACEHVRDCGEVPQRKGPAAMVHVIVDHAALTRGELADGETCEIAGVGPVPVATAQALASDAFIAALVSDGIDIQAVSHMGRKVTARQRTALIARGRRCEVPGCDSTHGLQIDHTTDYAKGGPTKLDNLAWFCPHHHYLKTHKGYRFGGPPGARTWHPPGAA